MLTGDLDRALAAETGSAGTWRPAPPGAARAGPGTYATSAAFPLARARGVDPSRTAHALAARLAPLAWVSAATVTGGGYLTVTVTPAALAGLAVRITEAGPACARSGALSGTRVTAPRRPRLAAARTWAEAKDRLARHLTGRLAEAAGASVAWIDEAEREDRGRPGTAPETGPVAEAIAFAGLDAVTFALARQPPGAPAGPAPAAAAAHHLGNPAYAVRYAHAHAASVLRQAADLGLDRGEPAAFQPRLLGHPSEQALLDHLSWLPERAAGAARRGQPDVLARYLEDLAGAWLGCFEQCPAAWPGTTAGPGDPVTAARLWLAAAAITALAAGLDLLGVTAPDRL